MADCTKCKHNYKPSNCEPKCNRMCDGESDFKSMSNADRIRNMTDKEMAEFFDKLETVCDMCACNIGCCNVASKNCKAGFLKWLQSEVEGE